MQLIGVQLDIVWEDKAATFDRVRRLLEASRPARDALVVLPEMFSTGFSMNLRGIAEGEDRPAERFLQTLAREYGVFILGGVVNIGGDRRGRNQAIAFSPDGQELVRYDKMYPFSPGGESDHYTAGEELAFFDWKGAKVAPFICYDLRFPELFRQSVRQRPHVMAVIASWPNMRESHWVTLLQARAIENLAYVIGVNRCGSDPKFKYPGRSMIVDPHGKVLKVGGAGEGLISAEIDPQLVDSWRRDFPVLNDMK
jgi:omega-amidase